MEGQLLEIVEKWVTDYKAEGRQEQQIDYKELAGVVTTLGRDDLSFARWENGKLKKFVLKQMRPCVKYNWKKKMDPRSD